MATAPRNSIYTISKLGKIKINGVEVDESNPDSKEYQRHEELLRSGIGPTPITDLDEELKVNLTNLKKRYSDLISAIPGMQEGLEKVAFGEDFFSLDVILERDRLKAEYYQKRDTLITNLNNHNADQPVNPEAAE